RRASAATPRKSRPRGEGRSGAPRAGARPSPAAQRAAHIRETLFECVQIPAYSLRSFLKKRAGAWRTPAPFGFFYCIPPPPVCQFSARRLCVFSRVPHQVGVLGEVLREHRLAELERVVPQAH